MKKLLYIFTIIMTFVLTGCSGGSDSPPESNYSLSVSQASVEFSTPHHIQENGLTATITVNYKGDGLLVGYLPNAEVPHWLEIVETSSTASTATITLIIHGYTISAPLVDKTTVRFVTGKADGSVVKTVDVPVTYHRTDVSTFIRTDAPPLLATEKNVSGKFTLPIFGHQQAWTITSDQPWVDFDINSGNGRDDVIATINDGANTLAPGEHKVVFTLLDEEDQIQDSIEGILFIDEIRTWFETSKVQLTHYNDINTDRKAVNAFSHQKDFDVNEFVFTTNVDWLNVEINNASQITLISNEENLAPGEHLATVNITGPDNDIMPISVKLSKVSSNINDTIRMSEDVLGHNSRGINDVNKHTTYWFDNGTNELVIKNSLFGTSERSLLPDAHLDILNDGEFNNSIYTTNYYQLFDGDNLVMQVQAYDSDHFSVYNFDTFTKTWSTAQTIKDNFTDENFYYLNFFNASFFYDGVDLTLRQEQIEYGTFSNNYKDLTTGAMYNFICDDYQCPPLQQENQIQGKYLIQVDQDQSTGEATDTISLVEINQYARLIKRTTLNTRTRQCSVGSYGFKVLGEQVLSCGQLFTVSASGELPDAITLEQPPLPDNRFGYTEYLDSAINNNNEIVVLWLVDNYTKDVVTYFYNSEGTFLRSSQYIVPQNWSLYAYNLKLSDDGQRIISIDDANFDSKSTISTYVEAVAID
ncbi:MAG: hypothetical protein GY787_22960 [Alteromonadales bacterium]|nr:hypothetical protein [Alteromonadales bacterium]